VVHVRVWDSEEEDVAREQDATHQSACLICSMPRIDVVKKGQLVERLYEPCAR
jgi:hypothetical protein